MTRREQLIQDLMGKPVHVIIDRPIGYDHKSILYPVNYGYIPALIAGDGEEQDAYILGVKIPLTEFNGVVIGAAIRKNDVEDKLIVAPEGMQFSPEEIARSVRFQEQFFETEILVP